MSDRVPMNCYGTRNAPRHDKPFAGRVDDSAAFEVGVAVESDLHRALRAIGVEFDALAARCATAKLNLVALG
eukprot:CAMPEP_0171967798 /NCGR_PEP_ID=MMETSP0993-20121228/199902_1 /TAXON_ID=483369 /ORGANISM="non described non described, Strain CCMP2098" /LENGTH=71 /DNA_ID=CAMNT_0012617385 /DNA_START=17 /DNA_END=229 /DNA_ORIENTATION=+